MRERHDHSRSWPAATRRSHSATAAFRWPKKSASKKSISRTPYYVTQSVISSMTRSRGLRKRGSGAMAQ
jgi:hypothetical protein